MSTSEQTVILDGGPCVVDPANATILIERAIAGGRDPVIILLRNALRVRSGKAWSVTGGKGTSYGWITITSPPARRTAEGYLTPEDHVELANLMGLPRIHMQGEKIPASNAHYRVALWRALTGRDGGHMAVAYWD